MRRSRIRDGYRSTPRWLCIPVRSARCRGPRNWSSCCEARRSFFSDHRNDSSKESLDQQPEALDHLCRLLNYKWTVVRELEQGQAFGSMPLRPLGEDASEMRGICHTAGNQWPLSNGKRPAHDLAQFVFISRPRTPSQRPQRSKDSRGLSRRTTPGRHACGHGAQSSRHG